MVEVTQEDRDAAAELLTECLGLHWNSAARIAPEHLARHRIAAENAAQEEITALRARIAEDQAQIAALTTYRENLRDEVIELRARITEIEAFQQQAIKQVCKLAREAGEAKGKLEASELPGIVDGWREKCERLERRVAELEARLEIDPAYPYDGIAARDATIEGLQGQIAELEAERAEWVEVERLRMGKATPPTPPA